MGLPPLVRAKGRVRSWFEDVLCESVITKKKKKGPGLRLDNRKGRHGKCTLVSSWTIRKGKS